MRSSWIGVLVVLGAADLSANNAHAQSSWPLAMDAMVTDSAGRPLAGVEFSDSWTSKEGRLTLPGAEGTALVSDERGRLQGTWQVDIFESPLLGLSNDRQLAATVPYIATEPRVRSGKWVGTIVMQDAVELVAEVNVPLSNGEPALFRCRASWVSTDPGAQRDEYGSYLNSWGFRMKDGQIRIVVPRSPDDRYVLTVSSRLNSQSRTMIIPPGDRRADLGAIQLPFSPLELRGALFPDWHVDAAQGIPLEHCQPCDMRGKPVLVLIRSYGPPEHGPRTDYEKTNLAMLAEHPQRDQFHVLILELDPWHKTRMQGAAPRAELFPVLTDWSGVNATTYGQEWDGVAILLDAEGRLDHYAPISSGAQELERMLAAAKAAPR